MLKFVEDLKKKTVADVAEVEAFQLAFVNSSDFALTALQRMIDAKVSSLPVKSDKGYIGFVDLLDITTMIMTLSDAKALADAFANRDVGWDEYLDRELAVLKEQTVGEMCNISERNLWCPLTMDMPMEVVFGLCDKHANVHRFPVMSADGKEVVSILSQSRLCRWLQRTLQRSPEHKALLERPMKELPLRWNAIAVVYNKKAIDGFHLILENKVTGIAVVDDDGKMFGSLSASDLKGSEPSQIFNDLYLPMVTYLERSTKSFGRENAISPVTCTLESTVDEVLEKLNSKAIHRIFVVDAQNRPVTVVSPTDILSYFGPGE